jgi:5'-phosphate synthase pdxT subunit
MPLAIGVLAIQGDVREHRRHLERLQVEAPEVRTLAELDRVDGLVMPGGESSTIGLLMTEAGLLDALKARIAEGFPVYGTCAGLILLAGAVVGRQTPWLGAVDITAARNAYGRQVASFEADLAIPVLGSDPFPVVFIRAPRITRVGPTVDVLARLNDEPVLVEQGSVLAGAFHPELTEDLRLHRYFVSKVAAAARRAS